MPIALPAAGGDGFGRLGAAVDEVAGRGIEGRPAGRIGEDLIALRRQIDRLEAEFSRRLERFEALGGHRLEGAASVVAWLRERCGLSAGGAMGRTEVARQLSVLPDARDLFAAGAIGLDSAQVLAHTVSDVGRDAAAAAAPELTAAALAQDPDGLRLCSRELRHQVDAEGGAAAHEKLFERRSLRLTQGRAGGWWLEGLLDPEGGALVSTALDALMRPLPGDVRSSRQRRADALVELATRAEVASARIWSCAPVWRRCEVSPVRPPPNSARWARFHSPPRSESPATRRSARWWCRLKGTRLTPGARGERRHRRCVVRWMSETAGASCRTATVRRSGATHTTWCATGATAAKPTSPTWGLCAAPTTECCTRVGGASCAVPMGASA